MPSPAGTRYTLLFAAQRKIMRLPLRLTAALATAALLGPASAPAAERYTFGVLPQRSAVRTAEYWNPVLRYVSTKVGVDLELKALRTGEESRRSAARGETDFIYSNHILEPAVAKAGYRILLKPRGEPIRGQIVCMGDSPVRSLSDLQGKEVGFPSRAAFAGYALPMDHLLRHSIRVVPVFGGNQEGAMGQLKAGRVAAVGVNSQLMSDFAAREGISIRVLWESRAFPNLPVAVHPRVPEAVARAVQKAMAEMDRGEEGARILAQSAKAIGQSPPFGFEMARGEDYRDQAEFYRSSLVKDFE